MSKIPLVAIIGRPNTGKSTLFNRLVGRRKSIVSDIAGTTRDHVTHKATVDGLTFLLVDTGGMGGGSTDIDLEKDVEAQSVLALEHADILLLTFNSREEITKSDLEIIQRLRVHKKKHVPIITVLTKCDDERTTSDAIAQFAAYAPNDTIVAISAPHKIGIPELEKEIVRTLRALHFKNDSDIPESNAPKIAIIGRPNVGKSSIINALMNEEQRTKSPLLVSDIPGTTRDPIDTSIMYHDKEYLFIDTAGIKRNKDTPEGIETHAYFRSIRTLEHCDIAVLVLDANSQVSKQDKRIATLAVSEGKGLIVLINKWDMVAKEDRVKIMDDIQYALSFCRFASFIPCSATSKEGLLKMFGAIESVQNNRTRRIKASDLQRWFQDTIHQASVGELNKCKYITQGSEIPPTFILFAKNPKKIEEAHLRYLENRLREVYDFTGTPIRFFAKGPAPEER